MVIQTQGGRDEAEQQADVAGQADVVDVTWSEHVLQEDGTWLHTKTVSQQVPAASVYAWPEQDGDHPDCSGYDDWFDSADLGDEL